MNIDHINISAPAVLLNEVRDFYCDVLGLTEGSRPSFSRKGYWLYAGENALVHLMESSEHYGSKKQGYFDHFALRTTGLASVLEKLREHGVSHRTSYLPEIGLTQIFCKDPSGTGVEINALEKLT